MSEEKVVMYYCAQNDENENKIEVFETAPYPADIAPTFTNGNTYALTRRDAIAKAVWRSHEAIANAQKEIDLNKAILTELAVLVSALKEKT